MGTDEVLDTRRPRREFLLRGGAGLSAIAVSSSAVELGLNVENWTGRAFAADESKPREKLPVAAVVTVYHKDSHADVIVGKILQGWRQDGGRGPDLKLASLYVDQLPVSDLSRSLAEKNGFRIAPNIDDALTFGTNRLQVAGVLSIGEHGDYPRTPDTQQKTYPRKRFFDEIIAAFQKCNQVVPVFNDKHLSYRWQDARSMVDKAHRLKIPFLAGSSLPVTWRMPPLELPKSCEIESALTIGYGGMEDYGFHAIEAHQAMIERRKGSETGVVAVQALTGDAIRTAESDGRWSSELFAFARHQMPGQPVDTAAWKPKSNSAVFLLEHSDGLQSAIIMANGLSGHFASAFKLKGQSEPAATWFQLEEGPPFGHFAYLLKAIEESIHASKAVYPVERTLLTTGILDRAMQSLATNGARIETPELRVQYDAADWPYANHSHSKRL